MEFLVPTYLIFLFLFLFGFPIAFPFVFVPLVFNTLLTRLDPQGMWKPSFLRTFFLFVLPVFILYPLGVFLPEYMQRGDGVYYSFGLLFFLILLGHQLAFKILYGENNKRTRVLVLVSTILLVILCRFLPELFLLWSDSMGISGSHF